MLDHSSIVNVIAASNDYVILLLLKKSLILTTISWKGKQMAYKVSIP